MRKKKGEGAGWGKRTPTQREEDTEGTGEGLGGEPLRQRVFALKSCSITVEGGVMPCGIEEGVLVEGGVMPSGIGEGVLTQALA